MITGIVAEQCADRLRKLFMRRRRLRVPEGHVFFAVAGALAAASWLFGSVVGSHPDGGLLGFSAGMWAVWSAMRKDSQRRDDRRQRQDNQPADVHDTAGRDNGRSQQGGSQDRSEDR